jgi:hypothetical protein
MFFSKPVINIIWDEEGERRNVSFNEAVFRADNGQIRTEVSK